MPFPMSGADAIFLIAETPKRPMHVGALALLSPPGNADTRYVRNAFTAAMARQQVAPLWRRRAQRSLTSLGQWHWRTVPKVELDYHVQIHALPRRAGLAALWELVSQLHAVMLDRSRPLWQLHLIEGLPDGRYGMYIKAHHALADGVSAMRLLHRTISAEADLRGMPALWEVAEPAPPPDPTTRWDRLGSLKLARAVLGEAGEVAGMAPALADTAWRAVRRRGGPLTLAAPHTPLNVSIDSARSFAGCTFPIERLRLVAKRADATVNDVVLAMCAGALRSYLIADAALPAAPLTAMVPVSLRDATADDVMRGVPGNKLGTLMCSLATHLDDPGQRLSAIRAGMREGKAALAGRSRRQVIAMSALGAVPLALSMMLGYAPAPLRPPNVMISNVPGPPGPLYWNGAQLDALYPLSIPVDGQALNITCTSTNDRIAFGLTGCRRAVPAMSDLTDQLARELDLLEAQSDSDPR